MSTEENWKTGWKVVCRHNWEKKEEYGGNPDKFVVLDDAEFSTRGFSCLYYGYVVAYSTESITEQPEGQGPLCVFRHKWAAVNFLRTLKSHTNYALFKCRYVEIDENQPFQIWFNQLYWTRCLPIGEFFGCPDQRHFPKKKNHARDEFPDETVLATKVQLIEVID